MNGSEFRLYNFAECRQIDTLSQQAGLSEKQLMGQAALASFYALKAYIQKKSDSSNRIQRILILCGPGNNGGDGLALGHLLLSSPQLGSIPEIHIFHSSGEAKSEAARFYWQLLKEIKFPLQSGQDFLKQKLGANDLLIEALLGTGQDSHARGLILEMLLHIRKYRSQSKFQSYPHLISLDIPAGLSEKDPADFLAKGFCLSPNIKQKKTDAGKENWLAAPDEIHCYGLDKLALRLSAALCAHSQIQLLPIGFIGPERLPLAASKLSHFPELYDEKNKTYNTLFRKAPTGHKYTAGHGLLIGGSLGMEGALLMAARAFFAAGGGILHALLPQSDSRVSLSKALPTIMFHDPGTISWETQADCILIGPGLKAEDLSQMESSIQKLIEQNQSRSYFLLDAAATKLIHKPQFPFSPERTILLAHTGEWKALGGLALRDTASLYAAMDFYEKKIGAKGHLLIKDSICTFLSVSKGSKRQGAEGLLFAKPQAALSVAGSGDSLAGILLALFSRKERCIPHGILNRTHREGNQERAGYLESRQECAQKEEVQTKVLLGLHLMHQALQGRIHPRSDEFALAIERVLMEDS